MIFSRETLENCAELSVGLGSLLGHKNWNRKRKKVFYVFFKLASPRFRTVAFANAAAAPVLPVPVAGARVWDANARDNSVGIQFLLPKFFKPLLASKSNTSEKKATNFFLFKKSPHGHLFLKLHQTKENTLFRFTIHFWSIELH